MPNTPYAKLQVSVNGGAPSSGGVTIPSAATIQLSGESTSAWLRARWEFVDYPEGWTAPAGWSTDANGAIYYLGITPPEFTMPAAATRWGKWFPRLFVNEQLDDSKNLVADGSLFDDATILSMLSPHGLRDIAARESFQFTGPTTRIKAWLADLQRNLRVIEEIAGGGGGGGDSSSPWIRYSDSGVDIPLSGAAVQAVYIDSPGNAEFVISGFKAPTVTPGNTTSQVLIVGSNCDGVTVKHLEQSGPADNGVSCLLEDDMAFTGNIRSLFQYDQATRLWQMMTFWGTVG